jgi:hypothetical protein
MMKYKCGSVFIETRLDIGLALAEIQKRVGLCIPNLIHLRELEYS